jgi:hypothetical protein
MAEALSRLIPNADGRLILVIRHRHVRQAERFGFVAAGEIDPKALGEKGREVQFGQGTLVFFEPTQRNSPLAALVAKQGLGPFGISVDVADLKTANKGHT